jgi:hypothetical protein
MSFIAGPLPLVMNQERPVWRDQPFRGIFLFSIREKSTSNRDRLSTTFLRAVGTQ